MKILALDTSTEACSVALSLGETVLERFELGRRHGERLLLIVQELLAESGLELAQLDAIAFGRGPGSFTSLRIGAGVVQGLAFGADLPVIPVSSLAALAQGAEGSRVLAAFDARMRQVYWGAYVRNPHGQVELQGREQVLPPQDVSPPDAGDWIGAGSGWDRYADELRTRLGSRLADWRRQCFPRARFVLELGATYFRLGKAMAPDQALPTYLRDDVAVKQVQR